MLNVLIAPDSFKGTLAAKEVCDIIGAAFEKTIHNVKITKLPVADGGEGLCSCFHDIAGGKFIPLTVTGVSGKKTVSEYLMLDDGTAVIETASCAGLPLAGKNNDPSLALTVGVGEMIKHAQASGAKKVLLGLGGSATNDCGIGMASALGWTFTDKRGNILEPNGKSLISVDRIIPPESRLKIPVTAACDVDNPLFGPNGAAYVYAPQKGADEKTVKLLDDGLQNISRVITQTLGTNVHSVPGSGAAGGMGAGVIAFLGGKLKRGIDTVLDELDFDRALKTADAVITGEGRLDFQSLSGKVISGVTERARKHTNLIITVCGCAGEGYEKAYGCGINEMFFSCEAPKPFEEIVKTCKDDLYSAAVRAAEYVRQKLCENGGVISRDLRPD